MRIRILFILFTLILLNANTVAGASLTSLNQLVYDSEGFLAHNYVLYAPDCTPTHRQEQRIAFVTTPSVLGIFDNSSATGVCAVCLQRGVRKDLTQYTLPYMVLHRGDEAVSTVASWVSSNCDSVELGVVNNLAYAVRLYWVDYQDGELHDQGEVLPGGEKTMSWVISFIGHKFIVVDSRNDETLREVVLEYDTFLSIGASKASTGDSGFFDRLENAVAGLLDGEWMGKDEVVRTFTPLGFSKGQLPRDVWASMLAYYHNNRENKIVEDFSNDILVNWWRSESWLITNPPSLKVYWQSRLKTLVEAWAGVPLELTDIYGVRQYEEGARLLMHVDRINTHAASIIINLHQAGMQQPWPVQIYDFAHRLHEVTMEPGEILYYESARCLHGRMTPLHGATYVNIFSHYRPLREDGTEGDSLWFKTTNPPGTPEKIPLSEDICSSAAAATAAVCKPHMSEQPFAVASSGRDLFKLWQFLESQ